MVPEDRERLTFTGFGGTGMPEMQAVGGVFILAVYRDDGLTATAHETERGAMESAVEYLEDELEAGGEDGTLDDRYARAQGIITDEGGIMEIIHSPIHRRGD